MHALLERRCRQEHAGECVAGFQRAEEGSVLIDGREQDIATIVARALEISMVYQPFTLAPGIAMAEKAVARGRQDASRDRLEGAACGSSRLSCDRAFSAWTWTCVPSELAAGEKQKLELLKQLYLEPILVSGRADVDADTPGGRRGARPCPRVRAKRTLQRS